MTTWTQTWPLSLIKHIQPAVLCPDSVCVRECLHACMWTDQPSEGPMVCPECLCVWSRACVYFCIWEKVEFVQSQRELMWCNVLVMINRWNCVKVPVHTIQGWVTEICLAPPHVVLYPSLQCSYVLKSDKVLNHAEMQITTVTEEQAHTLRCCETIPVQTWLWSAVAQRGQLMLLSLSLTAFGSSGGFLWSVFVNTREEEQLTATQACFGMSSEAVPWQSSRGQREGALWQSADYSAGHGAVYEDVIGAVVREKAVPAAAAVGWGVKLGWCIDAIKGLTILFVQRWSKHNTLDHFLSVKV